MVFVLKGHTRLANVLRIFQNGATPAKNGFSKTRTGSRIELALSLIEGAQNLYGKAKEHWRENYAYTIVISEKDALYSEVHSWLIATLPHERHRSLSVSTGNQSYSGGMEAPVSESSDESIPPLTVRFNESSTRTFVIEGHPITISIKKPDSVEKDNEYRFQPPAKIEFLTRTYEAQQVVIRKLEELNQKRVTTRKAVLRMVNTWGSWSKRSDLPPRTMASVSLPEEQKKRVVADLAGFLKEEDRYNRLAIPWHRGYMFYGPPGTGKTSLVKALANEFNLDLWYISLSDLKAEASLLSLLADVGPRSLLLLEDIDTMQITHDRDSAEQGKISMGSLLNTLDGVATPHGLITVMTTNRFELLDPALTRAGRMDLIEHLDYPTLRTLTNLFDHFYGVEPTWGTIDEEYWDTPIEGLSTAQVAEIMKRNMDDPSTAYGDIFAIVRELSKSANEKKWVKDEDSFTR
jgi:predicted AAA+ superfamily ATPase